MTTDTSRDPRLDSLGDALLQATTADLIRNTAPDPVPVRPRRRKRAIGALVVAVIAIPGGAYAAVQLISGDEVARSLPNGTLSLLNTDPTCTTVRSNVEYDCTLAVAPTGEIGAGRWNGTVEPSVDDSKHVNGGCRSLNAAGTHWRCYIGSEAVRQKIIGAGFLGEFAPSPGVG